MYNKVKAKSTTLKLKVVSRKSPLSLLQVREAFSFFPLLGYRLILLDSYGDKHKQISLLDAASPLPCGKGTEAGWAPDFFTRELDDMLIRGEADMAVHSAKDLPCPLPSELELFALFEALDKTDALVSKDHLTLARLPLGARVGTSSKTRKNELLNSRPDLEIVSIRGTIGERIAHLDDGRIDALVVATCALKRLGWEHRIAEILPFRTHPLQGHLAIVGRKDRPEIKALFCSKDIRRNYGKVTLVGFGPGNPDLLTIGGDKALAKADVIFHDDLVDQTCLSKYPGEKICVGKRKGSHRFHQDEINESLYQAAVSGKNTVRLKGGDPMVFAHGREELDFLQSRLIEVDIIPGISSGIALAACTHIPLTYRGVASSVTFVTGHSEQDVQTPDADTLVYYMGGANISAIAGKLIASGRREDLPAALVYNVSRPDQKVYYTTLKELQYSIVKYPTPILVVIGETVAFENRDSHKQPVLVTGTSSGEHAHYTNVTHTPLIEIRKIKTNKRLQDVLKEIHTFHWIIFTSRYGVRYFFETFNDMHADIRTLAHIRFASVGETTTSELRKYGIRPDLRSETESAEGLVRHFTAMGYKEQRILLPRSDKGLKYLSEELEKLGNEVADVPVYTNTVNREAGKTDISRFRKIIFSSPSGVDAFIRLYGAIPSGIQLIVKGETTGKKLKSELYATFQDIQNNTGNTRPIR
ncbi:MAG: uroporphyrinogen-III C-methyltransferase [Tannerella sp.]|jgi:uroporphyrinogen III methyltransferase/synthase|nr:uroporphyrinogen-III C-methyltransferase [Tannerella sp.]